MCVGSYSEMFAKHGETCSALQAKKACNARVTAADRASYNFSWKDSRNIELSKKPASWRLSRTGMSCLIRQAGELENVTIVIDHLLMHDSLVDGCHPRASKNTLPAPSSASGGGDRTYFLCRR
jgi:hypothetical protein